ncbi:PepSY domain-containing protein [Streptomyces sp. BA2]|uniref:PepSY domain-containing protein n=1 Tax=Streptomyces sp. BA2 TaxID=436595 RepID=UPI00132B5A8E|nr:PepSY domain-containing protein [Streptomyces sp. BA2]MWA13672.1 peptidase propeptide and YpeB domain protein [Streptomyces sp. BA2]
MKRNIVIATVAALALAGGGTATALAASGDDDSSAAAKKSSVQLKDDNRDNDRDDDRDDDRYDDRDDAKENTAEVKAAKVTAADAIDAALAKHSGTAVSAELDDEDGGLVWDVDLLKGDAWTSVQVDPGTGKVLGSHTEQDDDGDAKRVAAALKGASVNAADAAKAAGAKGTVTSVDLDDDGTAKAWEAETASGKGAESDWKVDLQSGKVSADKSDSHDDSDDNDSDDGSDD